MDSKEIIMAPSNDGGLLGGGGIGALLIGALLFGGGGIGGFGGNNRGYGYGAPAADAAATSVVLNPAFQSLQNQITNLSTALNTGDLQDSVHNVSDELLTTSAALQTAMAAGNFTTLNSINGLGRDVQATANQNALQQLNSFNQLTTTVLQGQNILGMQVQNSTNQIISQGTANAAAVAAGFCQVSRDMAQCCCEIKGAITTDGQATRELINNLNVQNLRDQLAAAQGKVSNNEQNQYLLSTILAHLTPTAAIVA